MNHKIKQIIRSLSKIIQSQSKEDWLRIFVVVVFVVIAWRLFQLQVLKQDVYEQRMISQHFQNTNIKAKRWNIFLETKSGAPLQLTNNIDLYDVFADPSIIYDKQTFINEVSSYITLHLCNFLEQNSQIAKSSDIAYILWSQTWDGLDQSTTTIAQDQRQDRITCLENLEKFTLANLIPDKPSLFYLGKGIYNATGMTNEELIQYDIYLSWISYTWVDFAKVSQEQIDEYYVKLEEYNKIYEDTLTKLDFTFVSRFVEERLDNMIYTWSRSQNFVMYIEDNIQLIDDIEKADLQFVNIVNNTLYFIPSKVENEKIAWSQIKSIFDKHNIQYDSYTSSLLSPKWVRYVKLITNVPTNTVNKLKDRQSYYRSEMQKHVASKRASGYNVSTEDLTPKLHWLWFEKKVQRTYPYGRFLSNVIWYIDNQSNAYQWIEKYFNEQLQWIDGKIIWFGTPWIWQVWSNDIQIQQAQNWSDIYLTIEPNIQKKLEEILENNTIGLRADSSSAIVMNPYNGEIVAMANYPDFDPNDPNQIYELNELGPEYRNIIDDITYIDIPVYIYTWWAFKTATIEERSDLSLRKYINSQPYGPISFLDRNIALPYEPGSIFKPITTAIALDIDEISLYDTYYDKWEIQVWDYFIRNVSKDCLGTNTYLHALQFSCNIGMISIIQKIWKYVFYNYLNKLWFGKITGIELAWEDPGSIPDSQLQERSRFFNNSFGQWFLATPLQMAVSYSEIINWWYKIKPTIVRKIYNNWTRQFSYPARSSRDILFKSSTVSEIITALYEVVNAWQWVAFKIKWYTLWGKTGTSQISFRGRYQNWAWWTNGSVIGYVTRDDLKYVIMVQVRRPRTTPWWERSAGKIFGEISQFIIDYDDIEK